LEADVPNYRIYMIGAGHIKAGYDFQCETDAFALSEAQSMLGEYLTAEVWLGTTLIGAVVLNTPATESHHLEGIGPKLTS
jgi:hypothetical protein